MHLLKNAPQQGITTNIFFFQVPFDILSLHDTHFRLGPSTIHQISGYANSVFTVKNEKIQRHTCEIWVNIVEYIIAHTMETCWLTLWARVQPGKVLTKKISSSNQPAVDPQEICWDLFRITPSYLTWNHFMASSLVTRCWIPTRDFALRLLPTL